MASAHVVWITWLAILGCLRNLASMVSKWDISPTYINRIYWGYNPLTNLLLACQDIQVLHSLKTNIALTNGWKMTCLLFFQGLCLVFGKVNIHVYCWLEKTQSASVDMVIARCTYRNINKYICIALLISSGSTITRSPDVLHQQQYVSYGMRETTYCSGWQLSLFKFSWSYWWWKNSCTTWDV